MTTGASPHHERESLFVADFYPQLGEYLAERHAAGYDADAGRARYLAWLGQHTDHDADDPPAGLARPPSRTRTRSGTT